MTTAGSSSTYTHRTDKTVNQIISAIENNKKIVVIIETSSSYGIFTTNEYVYLNDVYRLGLPNLQGFSLNDYFYYNENGR